MKKNALQQCIYKIAGTVGYSRFVARSNFGVGGQESSPQSLTAFSLNRYLLKKNEITKIIKKR